MHILRIDLVTKQEPKVNSADAVNPEQLQTLTNEDDSLFLVYELSKYYGNLMAVKEISFRVKPRECFGLLGVNGAGKSTTFRMLTGEEMSNSGIMYLGQAEIHSNRRKVTIICTQFTFFNIMLLIRLNVLSTFLKWDTVRKRMP